MKKESASVHIRFYFICFSPRHTSWQERYRSYKIQHCQITSEKPYIFLPSSYK